MAQRGKYPLHPSVGLWAFLEAFRKSDFSVDVSNDDRMVEISNCVSSREKVFSFGTTIRFDEILGGSGEFPVGCLSELVYSASGVCDQFFDSLPERYRTKKLRKTMGGSMSVGDRLGLEVSSYFEKFHENALLSCDGSVTDLVEPSIIHEVLSDFPLEVFARSISLSLQRGGFNSPTPEHLLDGGLLDEYDDDYHPSEDCLKSYFWGLYLEKLVTEKGFRLRPGVGDTLAALVKEGEGAVISGSDLWKGFRRP